MYAVILLLLYMRPFKRLSPDLGGICEAMSGQLGQLVVPSGLFANHLVSPQHSIITGEH